MQDSSNNKPTFESRDFIKIADFAQSFFLESKKLPLNSRELQIYLVLNGLKQYCAQMNLNLPFEIEDLNKERLDAGGLDDIG
jgi:hypothetical protein